MLIRSTRDWTPGLPLDRRPAAQAARAQSGVRGDIERSAARVVARLTGERVELIDDGQRDSMPDIMVDFGGRVAYVEVVMDADPAALEIANLLRTRRFSMNAPSLAKTWWLGLGPSANLKRIEAEAPAWLAELEDIGYTVPALTEIEFLADVPPPLLRLITLGVAEIATGAPARSGEHAVRLLARGTGGYPEDGWEGFLAAVSDLIRAPQLADVRSKLIRTNAAERHAFVGTTETSDWALNYSLAMERASVPDRAPSLPEEITHLWLWGRVPFGRVLYWSPDRSWLDVRRHWRTP